MIADVIDALNNEDEEWDSAPLYSLLKAFRELNEIWSQPGKKIEKSDGRFFLSKALEEPWQYIAAAFRQYRAYPSLLLGWELHKDAAWHLEWLEAEGVPHLELRFALDLFEIFRAGKINSIKECAECFRWLMARFPHQRFCSEECKEHFHRSNEADKVRRREWARSNYQSRKELELGSRKAAQLKGGKR